MWQSKVPPRVAFFSWIAALGKILTMDNFWKRHIAVLEWYFMVKDVENQWIIFFFIFLKNMSCGL